MEPAADVVNGRHTAIYKARVSGRSEMRHRRRHCSKSFGRFDPAVECLATSESRLAIVPRFPYVRPRPAGLGSRRKARGVSRRAILALGRLLFPLLPRMLLRHAAGGADWPRVPRVQRA
jgi:hypothetical protein